MRRTAGKTKADIQANSSPTFKWGVCLVNGAGQWIPTAFFKTEKAAKQFALSTGKNVFLIARRFDAAEAARSRGM